MYFDTIPLPANYACTCELGCCLTSLKRFWFCTITESLWFMQMKIIVQAVEKPSKIVMPNCGQAVMWKEITGGTTMPVRA